MGSVPQTARAELGAGPGPLLQTRRHDPSHSARKWCGDSTGREVPQTRLWIPLSSCVVLGHSREWADNDFLPEGV